MATKEELIRDTLTLSETTIEHLSPISKAIVLLIWKQHGNYQQKAYVERVLG